MIQNLQSFGFQYPSWANYHSPADGVLQMVCNWSCVNIFSEQAGWQSSISFYFSTVSLYLRDVGWEAEGKLQRKIFVCALGQTRELVVPWRIQLPGALILLRILHQLVCCRSNLEKLTNCNLLTLVELEMSCSCELNWSQYMPLGWECLFQVYI